jgi:hypothetical protein
MLKSIMKVLVTILLIILMMGGVWIAMIEGGPLWLVLTIKLVAIAAVLGLMSLVKYVWTGEMHSFWVAFFPTPVASKPASNLTLHELHPANQGVHYDNEPAPQSANGSSTSHSGSSCPNERTPSA